MSHGRAHVEELTTSNPTAAQELEQVLDIGRRLRNRQLHKLEVARSAYQLSPSWEAVGLRFGGTAGAANRLESCRTLEDDFRLPRGSVVMYCPLKPPMVKIALVQVLVHDQVKRLHEMEAESSGDRDLTAGLLKAQVRRFLGLWRFQISLTPSATEQLRSDGTRLLFEQAVEALLLESSVTTTPAEDVALDLARSLARSRGIAAEIGQFDLAARGRWVPRRYYPSGVPSLSDIIENSMRNGDSESR